MTNLRTLLGANIKIYRNERGLSQAKLAEQAGTATNYICAIEAGRRFPSVEILEKIALALQVDTPDLFSAENARIPATKAEIKKQILSDVEYRFGTFMRILSDEENEQPAGTTREMESAKPEIAQ